MNATEKSTAVEVGQIHQDRQVVALHLGNETYGVDIASIHSVLVPQPITEIPNVPHFVKGVINLRGKILPVMDLRARFGMPKLEESQVKSSRVVVVEAGGMAAALIVDSVSEVLTLPANSVEPPSSLLGSKDLKCLTGIGRVDAKTARTGDHSSEAHLILILDIVETISSIPSLPALLQ